MDSVNVSVNAGMATVVVSVNAIARGGCDLATGEHFLEPEKSGNC